MTRSDFDNDYNNYSELQSVIYECDLKYYLSGSLYDSYELSEYLDQEIADYLQHSDWIDLRDWLNDINDECDWYWIDDNGEITEAWGGDFEFYKNRVREALDEGDCFDDDDDDEECEDDSSYSDYAPQRPVMPPIEEITVETLSFSLETLFAASQDCNINFEKIEESDEDKAEFERQMSMLMGGN